MLEVATQPSGVVLITLDHGKVNALDTDLLIALIDAFARFDVEQPVVLTGAGSAFSAGVDLRHVADRNDRQLMSFLRALSDCFLAVFDHRGPVIAAINGPAIAGGCVIAAACDRRLISKGPIGLAELAVGAPFPTSAVEIMRLVLGPATEDLVLTARLLDAQQAVAVGLAHEIVSADELVQKALEQATTLRNLPTGVFAFTKRQLQAPARERIATRSGDDDPRMNALWASQPVREAITRYMSDLSSARAKSRRPDSPD